MVSQVVFPQNEIYGDKDSGSSSSKRPSSGRNSMLKERDLCCVISKSTTFEAAHINHIPTLNLFMGSGDQNISHIAMMLLWAFTIFVMDSFFPLLCTSNLTGIYLQFF